MLVSGVYITWPKQMKLWKVSGVVDSIVVVGVLTYALLHFMCDLKAAQLKVQCSLMKELMLYEFELSHDAVESTKNICCIKYEDAVDHR